MAHLVGGLLQHAPGHGFQVAVPALPVEYLRHLFPGREGLLHRDLVPFLGIFHALPVLFPGKVGNQRVGDGQLLEESHGEIVVGAGFLFHEVGVQAPGESLRILFPQERLRQEKASPGIGVFRLFGICKKGDEFMQGTCVHALLYGLLLRIGQAL